jgi:hypothetical protein
MPLALALAPAAMHCSTSQRSASATFAQPIPHSRPARAAFALPLPPALHLLPPTRCDDLVPLEATCRLQHTGQGGQCLMSTGRRRQALARAHAGARALGRMRTSQREGPFCSTAHLALVARLDDLRLLHHSIRDFFAGEPAASRSGAPGGALGAHPSPYQMQLSPRTPHSRRERRWAALRNNESRANDPVVDAKPRWFAATQADPMPDPMPRPAHGQTCCTANPAAGPPSLPPQLAHSLPHPPPFH